MAGESVASPHKVPNGATNKARARRSARRRARSPSASASEESSQGSDSLPGPCAALDKTRRPSPVDEAAGELEMMHSSRVSTNGTAAPSTAQQHRATVPKRGRRFPPDQNKVS